ncbi:hypothetical protein [Phocicoccus pinnipedialis]|uniref:DUF1659 domain-containing protein n=1 Tax=Phocicoccus pinnipedialis TaxID=110845 RepID=A0A6V7REW9_9BACL|nr:hypothetical protein [Jeotgalicoccus pinnipedialis]MBP1939184.1 hypothetical protein [Jeotgalicoccus pinnipedialis]CAD2076402.1 hypothetical protein JEOPIN946_01254 [Jeotgalicoccus pinnipedialis]
MVKELSARYYFVVHDDDGKERLKYRSIFGLSIDAPDQDVILLGEAYGALKDEIYYAVEKNVTHIIK